MTSPGVRPPKALRIFLEKVERNLRVDAFLRREAVEAEARRKAKEQTDAA